MDREIWIHQFDQQGEQTPEDYAATLLPRGIKRIYVKAMDGTYWMAEIYGHPMAPAGVAQMLDLQQRFAACGVQLIPWVVPRYGVSEAPTHGTLAAALGGLAVDFEFHYAGFFQGSADGFAAYTRELRAWAGDDAWLALAPDPRQVGRDYPASLLDGYTVVQPQAYWTDFYPDTLTFGDTPRWLVTLAQAFTACSGHIIEPILPFNATPDEMDAALAQVLAWGSGAASLWRMGVANGAELDAFGLVALPPAAEEPQEATPDAPEALPAAEPVAEVTPDPEPTEAAPSASLPSAGPLKFYVREDDGNYVDVAELLGTLAQRAEAANGLLTERDAARAQAAQAQAAADADAAKLEAIGRVLGG